MCCVEELKLNGGYKVPISFVGWPDSAVIFLPVNPNS